MTITGTRYTYFERKHLELIDRESPFIASDFPLARFTFVQVIMYTQAFGVLHVP